MAHERRATQTLRGRPQRRRLRQAPTFSWSLLTSYRVLCALHVTLPILTQTALEADVPISIFQVKTLSQSHTASEPQSRDSNPGLRLQSALCLFHCRSGRRSKRLDANLRGHLAVEVLAPKAAGSKLLACRQCPGSSKILAESVCLRELGLNSVFDVKGFIDNWTIFFFFFAHLSKRYIRLSSMTSLISREAGL